MTSRENESPRRKRTKLEWKNSGTRSGRSASSEAQSGRRESPPICGIYEDMNPEPPEPEAVFGRYPRGFVRKIMPMLKCDRREVLHLCSGTLRHGDGFRVDVRHAARPDVVADARRLPFRDGTFAAVLVDPPYTEFYASELYGVEYPRPAHLLAEAVRVVRPCGRVGFVHYITPTRPHGAHFVKTIGLSTGWGFPMRAVTIFERVQDDLFGIEK